MSFLAPLFLLGALAIALPVLFHLIRQTSKEKTEFSSLMFLLATPPRVTRRSRLEHLLLLALRCLVFGLLAFGFARPFFPTADTANSATGPGRRTVVLVDTSASLRREGLWAEARAKAEKLLRDATPADEIALFTFDRELRRLVTFAQWNATPAGERAAVASQLLGRQSPGWAGTHLGTALVAAAGALDEARSEVTAQSRQQRVVLISDLQEGARLELLQAYEWPKEVELVVDAVKVKRPSNAGVQLVADLEEGDRKQTESGVRVRVTNSSDTRREQFQLGWAGADATTFAGIATDIYVPPGQSRVVSLPVPPTGAERVLLRGDEEPFDNLAHVIPPAAARVSVLYLGREAETDPAQPLYFLHRAFPQTRRQVVSVIARVPESQWLPTDAESPLVVVGEALPEDRTAVLRRWLHEGKTAVLLLRTPASAQTLGRLVGHDALTTPEAQVPSYAMLAELDFRHPLLAPFADPRFSDFTKIHFWKYRRLDAAHITGARVVAKFDTGDPALLQIPLGKGTLFVLTAGWQPADSQLALSSKFVPLMFSLLEIAGGIRPHVTQHLVGDRIPLAATNVAATVRQPDGSIRDLPPGTVDFAVELPGIYSLASVAGTAAQRFAINLDPQESKTAPLTLEELERLGVPVKRAGANRPPEAETRRQLANAELEARQKPWRWLLAAGLMIACVETLLAGWLARRPAGDTVVPA